LIWTSSLHLRNRHHVPNLIPSLPSPSPTSVPLCVHSDCPAPHCFIPTHASPGSSRNRRDIVRFPITDYHRYLNALPTFIFRGILLNGAYRIHLGTQFTLASFLELLFPKHCFLKVTWGHTTTPSYGSRTILIQQRLSRAAKQSKRTRCHCSAGMSGLITVPLNQGSNAFACLSFTSFTLHFDVCFLSISISDSIPSFQLLWISVLLSCFLPFSSIHAVNSSVALPNQATYKDPGL
jgi:hypothetical protein